MPAPNPAAVQIVGGVRVGVLHDEGHTYVQIADAEFESPVMLDPPPEFVAAMVGDAGQAADFLREVKAGPR